MSIIKKIVIYMLIVLLFCTSTIYYESGFGITIGEKVYAADTHMKRAALNSSDWSDTTITDAQVSTGYSVYSVDYDDDFIYAINANTGDIRYRRKDDTQWSNISDFGNTASAVPSDFQPLGVFSRTPFVINSSTGEIKYDLGSGIYQNGILGSYDTVALPIGYSPLGGYFCSTDSGNYIVLMNTSTRMVRKREIQSDSFGADIGSFPTLPANYTYAGLEYDSGTDTLYMYAIGTASIRVSYDAQGGSVTTTTQTKRFGSTYGKGSDGTTTETMPIPTRAGYTFQGWYDGLNGTGNLVTDTTTVSNASDYTLYAKWTLQQITLTFDPEGGSVTVATITQTYSTQVAAQGDPTKIGYTFGGWYDSDNGSGNVVAFPYTLTSNVTVYAKWTANTYTVTYDPKSGSVTPTTQNKLFDSTYGKGSNGTTDQAMPTPTRAGYTFDGWYDGDNGTGNLVAGTTTVSTASNHTLYATWTIQQTVAVVSSLSATNGIVSIVLDQVPTVAPAAADFTATSTVGNGTAGNLPLSNFAWNQSTKTVSYSFTQIAKTAAPQSVVIAVSYKGATAVNATAFTVDAIVVTATVSTVTATNGTVTILLDKAPTEDPVAADFTATSTIGTGSANSVQLSDFAWDAATKTVTYSFPSIVNTTTIQSVVVAVTYKGTATAAEAFTVEAQPVIAEVGSVTATNGTVTIVLDQVPTVAPVETDFTATSKIGSGTATNLTLSGFAWNETTKTVTYSFTAIAKTATSQNVVIAVSYKGATAVNATAFTVDAIVVTTNVSTVTATNGTVSIVLDKVPTVAPVAADFTATSTIGTGSDSNLSLNNFAWDETTKTVVYSFTAIAETAASQSVVIAVSYKGATAVNATAFTVAASAPDIVTATVSSVTATNGTVSIVLDKVPTVAPIATDFTATSTISTGSAISLQLSNFAWDAATKTATYNFTAIASTNTSQSIGVSVSYKGAVAIEATAFTVAALAPEIVTATVSSVTATNGIVTIVLDKVPTVAPIATDFTVTSTISTGSAISLQLNNFAWDAATKTATYNFTAIASTNTSQSIGVSVSYKGAVAIEATVFTVAASTTNDSGSSNTGAISSPTKPVETGVEILVNGKTQTAATSVTTRVEGKTVTTVTVDDKKVEEKLQKEGNKAVLTIPVKNDSDVVVGQLNGQTVKNMENKEAVLEIKTENVTYTLPASQINIDNVSAQLGKQLELKDITVSVTIAEPSKDTIRIVEDTAKKNSYQVVVKPVEFEITCTSGNKIVDVSRFNGYVERTVAIPDGIDPSKITTGIVLNKDGTFSHVPTTIIKIDGKYYAKINSLTNSTYSVIWSPKTFNDVETHWAKEAVNDMGSRLVIGGVGDDKFEPNRDITRAEFATIVVKALGLMKPDTGRVSFNDVSKAAWYFDAVSIANEYGLISGTGNGNFSPNDKITREQAMTIIAKAMKITGLKVEFTTSEVEKLLSGFADADKSAAYAKNNIAACIETGIVSGRNGKTIAPKEYITRAEVAVMVRKLLQKSSLI